MENDFDVIYFFGDKTYSGGNDYEIFEFLKMIGYIVMLFEDICK